MRDKARGVEGVTDAKVEVVWDPPWTKDRMSDAAKLQLGMLAMQRGDVKQGEAYIRQAIRAGIPDKDGAAMAYLQMCQIYMNKQHFKAAKDMFRKAKAEKPKNKEVVDQIRKVATGSRGMHDDVPVEDVIIKSAELA